MSDAKATIISSVITGIFCVIAALVALVPQIITLQRENSALTEENDALQTQLESVPEMEDTLPSKEGIFDLETANALLRQTEKRYETAQANYEAALVEIKEKDAEISALKEQLNEKPASIASLDTKSTEGTLPYLVNGCSLVYDGSDTSKSFTLIDGQHTVGAFLTTNEGGWHFEDEAYALWNPASKYKTMSVTICSTGEGSADAKMTVEIDSEVVSTYDLKWEDPPRTFPIAIKGASKVKITLSKVNINGQYPATSRGHIYYGIYNIQFS